MLSQYNPNPDYPEQRTLPVEFFAMGLKPLGRLDYDSEGLLLLSDKEEAEQQLMNPKKKQCKVYLVQVEGMPSEDALLELREGGLMIRVAKKDHHCAPAKATLLKGSPDWVWEREPAVDTASESSWLELTLTEGKNRQVRRMTAKVGHPTLRLIRTQIAKYALGDLAPGEWRKA